MELELGGERLVLLPPGGAFAPAHGVLMVSDLHLGKGAAFRAAGRAVPAGTSAETLRRVSALLNATPRGTRLWILGDLFHAATGVTGELETTWLRWREGHPGLDVTLVEGNHDAPLVGVAQRWGCQVLNPPAALGPLELRHLPRERVEWEGDESRVDGGTVPISPPWGVAGHLHPVVRLREGRRSSLRIPCFWLRGADLILPALGAFVDGAALRAAPGDRVFVPAGDQVLEVPPTQLPSSARAG